MLVDRIWSLARQPFIFPCTPCVQHQCKWEIFAYGPERYTLCGALHVYDQLTCHQEIVTDDSILCSITGSFLNKIYVIETWSDREVLSNGTVRFCHWLMKQHQVVRAVRAGQLLKSPVVRTAPLLQSTARRLRRGRVRERSAESTMTNPDLEFFVVEHTVLKKR